MTLNVDVSKKAIERDMKMAIGVVCGVVAVRVASDVMAKVRDARQAKEIKRLKKQVLDLEERLARLEHARQSETAAE